MKGRGDHLKQGRPTTATEERTLEPSTQRSIITCLLNTTNSYYKRGVLLRSPPKGTISSSGGRDGTQRPIRTDALEICKAKVNKKRVKRVQPLSKKEGIETKDRRNGF